MSINEEKIISEIEKETQKENNFNPIHISELMSKEFKDTEWIVENLIPADSITAISGAPATYKTWIILELSIAIARGDVLFDEFITNQCGVLIIDEENGEKLTQKRFNVLNKDTDLPIYFLSLSGFKLTEDSVKMIVDYCKSKNIKVVIFDSLIRIHDKDENDASKMAEVFSLLKKLNKEGISAIFTHHNRKHIGHVKDPSQDMRGSSDILASLDCHLAVAREKDEGCITITQTKLRQEKEMGPFKLAIINEEDEFRFEYLGESDETKNKKANTKETIKSILSENGKKMFKKELFKAVRSTGISVGYKTFGNAIKEMVNKEELTETPGDRNTVYCSLPNAIQENGLFD